MPKYKFASYLVQKQYNKKWLEHDKTIFFISGFFRRFQPAYFIHKPVSGKPPIGI